MIRRDRSRGAGHGSRDIESPPRMAAPVVPESRRSHVEVNVQLGSVAIRPGSGAIRGAHRINLTKIYRSAVPIPHV